MAKIKNLTGVFCLFFSFSALAAPAAKPASPSEDAAATLVVFNQKEDSAASLAAAYAVKRGIPADHVIALSCPVAETISREDYDRSIAGPLRKILVERGWWRVQANSPETSAAPAAPVEESSIRFVALIRGIPLRIAPATLPYAGDRQQAFPAPLNHNEAAVDSELAMLGTGSRQITGPSPNPYYGNFGRFQDAALPSLLLVCRLDAATPETVRRMIDDSLAAEKSGLWGFAYVDSRNITAGAMVMGDEWMRRVASDVTRQGIPCIHENTPDLFPAAYPMRNAALYFGWYSEQMKGPFLNDSFRFVPGAVAVHLHSFSATSLRAPLRNWCAPLLERGAAATLGNVYEPYLHLTPNLDIFEQRLTSGFTFAEAAYASQRALSWMTTFIGDPLYRPFKAQQDKKFVPTGRAREWAAYRDGARLWFSLSRSVGEAALATKGRALKSGLIFEGLGSLQASARDSDAAVRSLAQARAFYTGEEDQLRCALNAVGLLYNSGKKKGALTLAREQIEAHPNAAATLLLRAMAAKLAPAPLPPSPLPAMPPGTNPAKTSEPPASSVSR